MSLRDGFTSALEQHLVEERAKPPSADGKGYGSRSAKHRIVGWGMLVGWSAIADYLGVSVNTAYRWRIRESLPVSNLPDGRVAISLSLIDQWLMARHTAQLQDRTG